MTKTLGGFVLALATACSGSPERAPFHDGPEAPAAEPAAPEEKAGGPKPCEAGTTKACKVTLPTHDGIASCYIGVRLCVEGQWSECGDEELLFAKYFGGS